MKKILLGLLAVVVAAPAYATTSNSIRVRTVDGVPGVLVYSKSIASTVIDTCVIGAGSIDWTSASLLNTGSATAADTISVGVDSSVDGTTWTQIRGIGLTGFVGAVAKTITMTPPGVYLRFRTVNRHTSTTKTVQWRMVVDTDRCK